MSADSLSPLRPRTHSAVRSALILVSAAVAACSDGTSLPTGTDPIPMADPVPDLATEVIPNSWTTRARMPTARSGLVAATVNGIVYAIGGWDGDPSTKVEAYNPGTSTLVAWTPKAPLPSARVNPNGAAGIDGKIYVPGGTNAQGQATRSLYVYDVAGNYWIAKAQMPVATYGGAAAAMGGKLYVLATLPGEDGFFTGPSRLFRYDPAANSWVELAPAPHHHHLGVVRAIDGKLYAAGGMTYEFVDAPEAHPWAELDVYDPTTNTWITKASMPGARYGGVAGVLNSKLYVAGGMKTDPSPVSTLQVYNPATNLWATRVDMPTPRAGVGGAVAQGKLYVLGGIDSSSNVVKTNEAYNP
jgi:N-acetylneuraminic acid mutarotase